MQTQTFTIGVEGGSMPSYLARPDGDEPRGAVIVLQEIFGVNTEVKRITDLVASAGYVGLAINYYWRTDPDLNEPYTDEGLQRGFAAAGHISKKTLRSDIGAAAAWLNGQSFVKKGRVATWGFCMGGSAAYVSATVPGIACAVSFYGGSIAKPFPKDTPAIEETAQIACPLLLAFGGKDDYIPHDAVEAIKTALDKAGKEYELIVYPEVGHAFFRQSSAAMNAHEVKDAWEKVQSFLKKHLA